MKENIQGKTITGPQGSYDKKVIHIDKGDNKIKLICIENSPLVNINAKNSNHPFDLLYRLHNVA